MPNITLSTSALTPRRRAHVGLLVLCLALLAPLAGHAACTAVTNAAVATTIANGHAYTKHQGEFVNGAVINGLPFPNATIANAASFATFVQGILNGSPFRQLTSNRVAYWHGATGTVVIHNPAANDCGTAFRPNQGLTYYNNLT